MYTVKLCNGFHQSNTYFGVRRSIPYGTTVVQGYYVFMKCYFMSLLSVVIVFHFYEFEGLKRDGLKMKDKLKQERRR